MARLCTLVFLMFFTVDAWAGGIAIVDFERAVNETNEGKQAQKRLDALYSERKAEIERLQKEFTEEMKDYESRSMILSEEARADTEKRLMEKQSKFESTYMQYQQEMQAQYMSLLQDLDEKMRMMTRTISKDKGYDLVLDKAAVVYVGTGTTDITNDLITRYNQATSDAN